MHSLKSPWQLGEQFALTFFFPYQVCVLRVDGEHVPLGRVQVGEDVSAVARDGLAGCEVTHAANLWPSGGGRDGGGGG